LSSTLPSIEQLLERMQVQLAQWPGLDTNQTRMVGIRTGGLWLARVLHHRLGLRQPLGALDISFYRDDFSRIGLNPTVQPSHLPWSVDDGHLILVDDILYTGRTIRAAMNALFDYGRPASITLAIAVDRGGRELPIQADVLGCRLELDPGEQVKLCGPDPLRLETARR